MNIIYEKAILFLFPLFTYLRITILPVNIRYIVYLQEESPVRFIDISFSIFISKSQNV
jgi:hypothetical protein